MSGNCKTLALVVVLSFSISACGFKSDLFLPGQPKNAGQIDSSSIENLKQQTLDTLEAGDLEAVETQIRGGIEEPTIEEDGVPVNLVPLSEEIEKNKDKKNRP